MECLPCIFPIRCYSRELSDSREGLLGVLAGDPRPRYQEDPQRVYGLSFAGRNVKFTVDGDRLTVIAVE